MSSVDHYKPFIINYVKIFYCSKAHLVSLFNKFPKMPRILTSKKFCERIIGDDICGPDAVRSTTYNMTIYQLFRLSGLYNRIAVYLLIAAILKIHLPFTHFMRRTEVLSSTRQLTVHIFACIFFFIICRVSLTTHVSSLSNVDCNCIVSTISLFYHHSNSVFNFIR